MSVEIYPIDVGFDRVYVIKDKGTVMVDAGMTDKSPEFEKGIKKISLDPKKIDLIVITHGHWDHIGAARDVQELTGAKIAMHKNEKNWLEEGYAPMPPGVTPWGKFFAWAIGLFPSLLNIPATRVDIALDDNEFSLDDYGISGKVIPTPGHSSGSVSVLLDSGEVFVGDLAMNRLPLRLSPGLPIFAEDLQQVKKSWEKLLSMGAKVVYPAHGNSFPASVIENALNKM